MVSYEERHMRAIEAMRRHSLDALLLSATDHMRYLIGWAEPPGERFLGLWFSLHFPVVAIVPELYREHFEKGAQFDVRVVPFADGADWCDPIREELTLLGPSPRIAVDEALLAGHLLHLQDRLPGAQWVSAASLMQELRGVKSPDEVALLQESAAMADRVYSHIVPEIRAGMSERELEALILRLFALEGAETSWAIVAFGANSSMPHHRSGTTCLEPGMIVVLDMGGSLNGYQSDITRTLAAGIPEPEAETVYEIVYRAHMAVITGARPGMRCCDADRLARHVIEDAGYGRYFIHRTGHGIGLSTHEPPNLSADDATVLQPGMCFSDEPGIYLPSRFGVRIENIIAIEHDSVRSLNAAPPATLPVLEI